MHCSSCKQPILPRDKRTTSSILGCESFTICAPCFRIECEMIEKEGTNFQPEVAKRYRAPRGPFVVIYPRD